MLLDYHGHYYPIANTAALVLLPRKLLLATATTLPPHATLTSTWTLPTGVLLHDYCKLLRDREETRTIGDWTTAEEMRTWRFCARAIIARGVRYSLYRPR